MLPFLVTINQHPASIQSIHPLALLVPRFQGESRSTFPIVSGRFRPRRIGSIFLQCTSPPAPPIGGFSTDLPDPIEVSAHYSFKSFRCNTYRKQGHSSLNQKTCKASPQLYSLLPEGPFARSRQKCSTDSQRAVSHRESARRQPGLSCFDSRIPRLRAQNPCPPCGHEQLRAFDCFFSDRLEHSGLFWNLHSRRSGRRRPHCY